MLDEIAESKDDAVETIAKSTAEDAMERITGFCKDFTTSINLLVVLVTSIPSESMPRKTGINAKRKRSNAQVKAAFVTVFLFFPAEQRCTISCSINIKRNGIKM